MIVTLHRDADVERVRRALSALGLWTTPFRGGGGARHLLVRPGSATIDAATLAGVDGVADVAESPSTHPRVDALPPEALVEGVRFAPDAPPVVIAGPCSVESREHVADVAARLSALGVRALRGGAFKPRTSPYEFQGRGAEALRFLRDAADASGMIVVSEALSEADAPLVAEHADLVQIGSRNMHASALLRAVGRLGRPVLLKRGMAATLEEWLHAAEYCLDAGAPSVVFCERGIRGFDVNTRNLLDLASVALLRHVHGLPVVVDPSHAVGRRDLIAPLARAAVAAGALGLLVEVHDRPGEALSDGPQALDTETLREILDAIAAPSVPPKRSALR